MPRSDRPWLSPSARLCLIVLRPFALLSTIGGAFLILASGCGEMRRDGAGEAPRQEPARIAQTHDDAAQVRDAPAQAHSPAQAPSPDARAPAAGTERTSPAAAPDDARLPSAALRTSHDRRLTIGDDAPPAIGQVEGRRAGDHGRLPPPDANRFPGLQLVSQPHDVWVDIENNRVVMQAGVCLREGPLELLACIHQWVQDGDGGETMTRRGTKEYESLLTINTSSALVHAALLTVGAEPGAPVQFRPAYRPAYGERIEITLHWHDDDGQLHVQRAQEWVRNVRTGAPMEESWVFAGSDFDVDPQTGQEHYLGEEGNLICISNFPDAVLDLPIPSSAANQALLFEANSEAIPPVGTTVTIVMTPQKTPADRERQGRQPDDRTPAARQPKSTEPAPEGGVQELPARQPAGTSP